MLLKAFAQLFAAMPFTALGQQIDDLAAGFDDPVDAAGVVDKPQNLDRAAEPLVPSPFIDVANRLFFTL